MEIAIIDIETTGFNHKWDAIVEIGITLVDTEKKTRTLIFDKVIKETKKFQPNWDKHKNAWIFSNSDLTIEDVMTAETMESNRAELQEIFDKYPVTAFNSKFDFGFMDDRGFKLNKIKCLMLSTKKVLGVTKWPSVIEAYNKFFPNEKDWDEKHRGGSDSMDEARILLHLCELKEERKKLLTESE